MNIKKCIFITEVITILNEAGEKRVKEATSAEEPTDENGFTLEWYEENNLRPPSDLLKSKKSEIDSEGFMNISADELTYDFQNRFIDITDLLTVVEADEFGTIIQFNNGMEYWCEEDIFEMYARIYVTQMSWFERVKESVSTFFGALKDKLTNKNNGKQN